jgi:hypothetical protein
MAANRDEVAIACYRHHVSTLPDWVRIAPPARFGEIGWLIDGAIVNHDTAAYAERIALLHQAGLLEALRNKWLPRFARLRLPQLGDVAAGERLPSPSSRRRNAARLRQLGLG